MCYNACVFWNSRMHMNFGILEHICTLEFMNYETYMNFEINEFQNAYALLL